MSKSSLTASLKAQRDHERRSRRMDKQQRQRHTGAEPTTPKLTNWAGMLTLDGEALADYLIAAHQVDDSRAAARMFAERPDKATEAWAAFQKSRLSNPATL